MKVFIQLLLLQCFLLSAAAQQTTIDSLKKALQSAKQDTNKVILLAALSYQYGYAKPDSAILFAQEGYDLSQQLKYLKGEALCLNRMGSANVNFGNAPKALELLQKARAISREINDETGVARSLNNIATIYGEQGDYAKALPYLLEVKQIDAIAKNPVLYGILLVNIAECYSQLNRLDSALLYAQQAYERSRQQQNDAAIGDVQRILGDIETKRNNLSLALKYYRESIVSSNKGGDTQHTGISNLSIAKLYQKSGQTDSVLFYGQKALQTAQAGGFLKDILNASELLAATFEKEHQYADAYRYFRIATTAKDSLFSQEKVKQLLTLDFDEKMKQHELEAAGNQLRDKIRIYSLLAGLAILLLVAILLIRNNRHKQKAYTLLQKQKQELDIQKAKAEQTLLELKATQTQLIQSEKMASLGQLTAGIAHEIQNPLNFVNNFSEINAELLEDLEEAAAKGHTTEVKDIINDIKSNEQKITYHGKRADSIVKGMLQHSRASTGKKEDIDINELVDETLRLSYHGLRAKNKHFNVIINTDYEHTGKVNIVPQDVGRVLLNLFNNAFYTTSEKKMQLNGSFEPTIKVHTKNHQDKVEITINDNGNGIPRNIIDKIFEPFFTTKPTGQGTGLGLSLSYDIIKAHGGEIKVESKEGEGTEFIISLPLKA